MALIMITGDFLGMSLTTDTVQPSTHPNSWRIGGFTVAGVVMALGELAFCVAVLAIGDLVEGYDIETGGGGKVGEIAVTFSVKRKAAFWPSGAVSFVRVFARDGVVTRLLAELRQSLQASYLRCPLRLAQQRFVLETRG
jgi:hypothetical protein